MIFDQGRIQLAGELFRKFVMIGTVVHEAWFLDGHQSDK